MASSGSSTITIARGAPFGPDDGTVAPWVVVASLPFAPEIVIPTVRNFAEMNLGMTQIRLQAVVQSVVFGGRQPNRLVGDAVSLWNRPRAGHSDDRESPHWFALEHHAALSAGVDRFAAGRLYRGLVVNIARLDGWTVQIFGGLAPRVASIWQNRPRPSE